MARNEREWEGAGGEAVGRRELLSYAIPLCGMACLGAGGLPELLGAEAEAGTQGVHPFDVKLGEPLSTRERVRLQCAPSIQLIATLRSELGDEETIRLLSRYSAERGRLAGKSQARRAPDTTFRTFTATFRPPAYANSLVHEVVEDTDAAFGLRVTECVWAAVFKEAGLSGPIGYAAVCNMDHAWPGAFNPRIHMERTRTLMQGHDHCDHRYLQKKE